MRRLDRRAFLKLTGASAVLLGCEGSGLDGLGLRPDTFEDDDTDAVPDVIPEDTNAPDTIAEPDTLVATEVEDDIAPDVTPDAVSDVADPSDAPDDILIEDVEADTMLDVADDVPTIGPLDPPWDLPEAPALFPFGVQAGDASTTSAILQVHYLGAGPLRVSIRRLDEPDFDRVAVATPNDVGAVRIHGINLMPGARYTFVFWAPEGRSNIGFFRTALAPGQRRTIRFAGSACTNIGVYPFTPLARAADLGLDFYLLAGDTTYCDGARSLTDYRGKWRQTRATPEYQALFASCGVYATWDDHEVDNDWNPETTPLQQVDDAVTAWEENMPLRAREPDGTHRIYRSQRWGDVLELFVLDCRGERKPSTQHTPQAQYISRAQMDWLKAGLSASTARWKIILNSVPITHMPDYFQQVRDRWDKYPVQRSELLEHIASLGPDARVLFVAGDYHFGTVTHVDRAGGPHIARREVLMGPAGNNPNSQWQRAATEDAAMFEWATGTKNTAVFTLDPDSDAIHVQWVDGDGNVLGARDLIV